MVKVNVLTTVEYGKGRVKFIGFDTETEKLIVYAGGQEDLLGTNFFHNFPNLEMTWSFRTKTITLTEIEEYSDDNEEQYQGNKEVEKVEKNMGENESFKQEFEQNKAFYQEAKSWILENHFGRYVIIGAGRLLDVQDTYDLAIKKANELKRRLLHVMVFKAEE